MKNWQLMAQANDGTGGGAGAGAGTGAGAGAGSGSGSGGEPPDWRAAVAAGDKDVLEGLKTVEHPRALYDAHVKTTKWRESLAGDNPDDLKTLERFASPKVVWDGYKEFRTKLSKGELKAVTPYPEKGTEEQKGEWRSQNGVPATPGDYKFELPAGMVIGEEDKPAIASLTKYAHSKNLPNSSVNEVVNWYFNERAERQEASRANFEEQKKNTTSELAAEWGPDYKGNFNRIQGVLDSTIPADQGDLKNLINNALATNAHFARHYAAIALQLNPASTLVPGDHGANEGSVVDEIKKIETSMRKDRSAYNKDEGVQTRYRDLIGAYQRLTGKEWGAS